MSTPTPDQVSNRLRQMADAIDNSKNPDPARVAADIKRVIASLRGAASKVAPEEARPVRISFKGALGDADQMARAAAYMEKKHPGLKGKKFFFHLVATPVKG